MVVDDLLYPFEVALPQDLELIGREVLRIFTDRPMLTLDDLTKTCSYSYEEIASAVTWMIEAGVVLASAADLEATDYAPECAHMGIPLFTIEVLDAATDVFYIR
jgi:hypothetical protein